MFGPSGRNFRGEGISSVWNICAGIKVCRCRLNCSLVIVALKPCDKDIACAWYEEDIQGLSSNLEFIGQGELIP